MHLLCYYIKRHIFYQSSGSYWSKTDCESRRWRLSSVYNPPVFHKDSSMKRSLLEVWGSLYLQSRKNLQSTDLTQGGNRKHGKTIHHILCSPNLSVHYIMYLIARKNCLCAQQFRHLEHDPALSCDLHLKHDTWTLNSLIIECQLTLLD